MKITIKSFLLLLLSVLISGKIFSDEKEKLVIENEVMSKVFSFNTGNPGAINVSLLKKPDKEELTSENKIPLFKFVTNKKLVTANDPFCVFKEHITHEM